MTLVFESEPGRAVGHHVRHRAASGRDAGMRLRRHDLALAPAVESIVPEHDQPRDIGEATESDRFPRGAPGNDRHPGTGTGDRPQRRRRTWMRDGVLRAVDDGRQRPVVVEGDQSHSGIGDHGGERRAALPGPRSRQSTHPPVSTASA